ncbi:MAG TPA: hypothetical protein VMI94_09235 [Bryobacteraceae bacterium]|nr:hypothetical protein [Bryobacteraceae bacterium]
MPRRQEPAPRYSLLRWLFSFPAFLATALMGLTVITVRERLNDPDLWWHLKLGEIIWRTRSIPRADFLSYTTHGHAWIAHEWLAQLSIYGAWRLAGDTGLMLWLCVVASLLFVTLYVFCSLYSGNAKVSLLGGLIGWAFATVGLAVRPLLLGHFFLVLELLLVHLARTRDRRWFWGLPWLFALWANCHGSYMLGLLVLGLIAGCSFFDFSYGSVECQRWSAALRRRFVAAAVLSAGALFLNPFGIRLVLYPFDLLLHQTNNIAFVSEWQPLNPHDSRAWALYAVVGIVFLAALSRRWRFRLEELALLALGLGMAVLHERMLFAFGILAAPLICRLCANAWERYDPARDLRFMNALLMAGICVGVAVAFPSRANLQAQVAQSNPVQAVDYIRGRGLSGPMLNDYDFGGYLIWALPDHKVFIDGRADVYDWTGVFGEMARWALLQEDPTRLLAKYGINFCLLHKTSPMAQVLPFLPGWKRIYSDRVAVVFARDKAGAPDHR